MNDITKTIVNFNELFYGLASLTWDNTHWKGNKLWKNPMDLWVMQEIIYETKPDIIVETGTFQGGSALFFRDVSHALIITIDVNPCPSAIKGESGIVFIQGDSTDKSVVNNVLSTISANAPNDRIMIVLDSDHSYEHVKKELELYAPLVTPGCYLIVEDTNVGGPIQAVSEFTNGNKNFIIDRAREKYLVTFNPCGYIKRI